MAVLHSPRAGSQPVRSVRGGGRPLPERTGQQPATARRGTHDEGTNAVGRAAALNGRAAGNAPGWEGGSGLRLRPYVLSEVASLLGVGERQAHRLAKPHALGLELCYHEGRAKERRLYDVQGIQTLARAREVCRQHLTDKAGA